MKGWLTDFSALTCDAMALTSSITSYDPSWPQRYVEAATRLAPIFGVQLLEMHHVGSTAVPELAEVRTHKVHICTIGHRSIEGMLRFRDHLRGHPEDRARYGHLKRQLERANTAGISEYLAGGQAASPAPVPRP